MNVRAIVCMYITWSVEFHDLFDAALCLTLSVSPLFLSPPLSLSLSPTSRVGKGYMYTLNYMYHDPLQYTIMALSFSPIPTWILLQLS